MLSAHLKGVIIGLLGFAAAEEQMLLAAAPAAEPGGAQCWAAVPLVACTPAISSPVTARLSAATASAGRAAYPRYNWPEA